MFVSLWEASVSFLCTPDWAVWFPDNIRLSEISAHEGAVKLVKAHNSCPSCLCCEQCKNSCCECGTILIACLHCHCASQMSLSLRAYCRGCHRSWPRSRLWSLPGLSQCKGQITEVLCVPRSNTFVTAADN